MTEPMSIESNLALLNIKVTNLEKREEKLKERIKVLEDREKARTGYVTLLGVGR